MTLPHPTLEIKNYSAAWHGMYHREAVMLRSIFWPVTARIEHVGSTAVKGLSARPIIDIMVGFVSVDHIDSRAEAICKAGYTFVPELADEVPGRHFFYKTNGKRRTFHLHCVLIDSDFFVEHILFRDYLQRKPAIAKRYAALKKRLCQTIRSDRIAYNQGKCQFIKRQLAAAKLEPSFTREMAFNTA